jgi:hypothetical protein
MNRVFVGTIACERAQGQVYRTNAAKKRLLNSGGGGVYSARSGV